MSDAAYKCVKCGSGTAKGFVADHGSDSAIFTTMWFDGQPEQASLFGIKGANISADRSKQKAVRGLRCTRCGFLELYAV